MIVVNARFLTQKLTGVQRFAIELSLQLKAMLGDDVAFLSPKDVIHEEVAFKLGNKTTGNHTGHLWEQWDLPRQLRKMGNPLLLCLCNTAPILYSNKVDTLHDITCIRYPGTYSRKFRLFYRLVIPMAIWTSRHLLTVSEFSKSEISSHYHVPARKIDVIYNAVGSNFHCVKEESLRGERYLVTVSSLKENKNFQTAVLAFIAAQKEMPDLHLYIVGDLSTGNFKAMPQLLEICESHPNIRLLGRVSDENLIRYYSNALAFVFPSFYEGFGIPVLEAQACGCPVLSSSSSSLPEVLGDSALFCDPNNVKEFTNAIKQIVDNEELRGRLVSSGYKNIKRFRWESSADKLLNVLR